MVVFDMAQAGIPLALQSEEDNRQIYLQYCNHRIALQIMHGPFFEEDIRLIHYRQTPTPGREGEYILHR